MQYGTLYVQQKAKVANEYIGVTARPISCMFNEQRKPFGSDVLRFLINKLPASSPLYIQNLYPQFLKGIHCYSPNSGKLVPWGTDVL